MEHFYKSLNGHFNFQDHYSEMVEKYPTGSHFVEIGCFRGKSTSYLAVEIINSEKDIRFDCIDIWEKTWMQGEKQLPRKFYSDTPYEDFIENTKSVEHIIHPHQMKSVEAAGLFEDKSIDFLFIDGGHEYEEVMADLVAWWPKMAGKGTISGHDYRKGRSHLGVSTAVDEFFGKRKLEIKVKAKSVFEYILPK